MAVYFSMVALVALLAMMEAVRRELHRIVGAIEAPAKSQASASFTLGGSGQKGLELPSHFAQLASPANGTPAQPKRNLMQHPPRLSWQQVRAKLESNSMEVQDDAR